MNAGHYNDFHDSYKIREMKYATSSDINSKFDYFFVVAKVRYCNSVLYALLIIVFDEIETMFNILSK